MEIVKMTVGISAAFVVSIVIAPMMFIVGYMEERSLGRGRLYALAEAVASAVYLPLRMVQGLLGR